MCKSVLFINSSLDSGGSERVMTLLANEYAKRGIETSMVLLREKKSDIYKTEDKVNIIRFKYGTNRKAIIAIKRLYKLRKLAANGHFDEVISFMYDINLTVLIALRGLHIPIIISERADPSVRKHSRFYRFIEHYYYLKAAKIVVQTPEVINYFADDLKDKCVIIPNPVNPDLPFYDISNRKKIIIAAGRMTEQKNFQMLINAFNVINKRYKDFKLIIYGEGPLLSTLKQQVNLLQLNDFIEFPGFTDSLYEKMLQAWMYVSSSNYEGISNSMIEALSMGLPCVCTDCPVGGASMMIQDGINGLLTPTGNVNALSDAMEKMIVVKGLAEVCSQSASKIREKYSIKVIVNTWINLL